MNERERLQELIDRERELLDEALAKARAELDAALLREGSSFWRRVLMDAETAPEPEP